MQTLAVADNALTADDYASIERASEELLGRGWQRQLSINEVVGEWESLVRSVEQGYGMTIDDFTNDVSIRRWPEEASPLLTPRVRQSMEERLGPLDARFRGATFQAPRRLPGAGADFWWETRLPRRLVGELAEDVERMDLGPTVT